MKTNPPDKTQKIINKAYSDLPKAIRKTKPIFTASQLLEKGKNEEKQKSKSL